MKKMPAEERRRAAQARTSRSTAAPSMPASTAPTRPGRSRSGLWSAVGIGLIAVSFIAASRVPSISFDVTLLRTASFLEWMLPRLP